MGQIKLTIEKKAGPNQPVEIYISCPLNMGLVEAKRFLEVFKDVIAVAESYQNGSSQHDEGAPE